MLLRHADMLRGTARFIPNRESYQAVLPAGVARRSGAWLAVGHGDPQHKPETDPALPA